MKKRIVTKKRAFLSSLALVLAMIMAVSPLFGNCVHADEQIITGDPYLADVHTSQIGYLGIKYCNDRNVFGEKKGTDFYMHPWDTATKQQSVTYLYNMYHKKVDFGNHKYRKVGNKAWRWAQSNGLVGPKTNPKAIARFNWFVGVIEKMSSVISGGSSGVLFLYDDTSQNLPITRWGIMKYIQRLGEETPEYDPKNLPNIK